ncbi:hypothetical protein YC2023_041833 [Brassica napus]
MKTKDGPSQPNLRDPHKNVRYMREYLLGNTELGLPISPSGRFKSCLKETRSSLTHFKTLMLHLNLPR